MSLFLVQLLNGIQLGIMIFLLASGLTLVFGIMGLINLSHGSLYMIGAYLAAVVASYTHSFVLGALCGLIGAGIVGLLIEFTLMRRLYDRDHLEQVLVTFGLVLFFNPLMIWLFGRRPLFVDVPEALSGSIEIVPGLSYPILRVFIMVVGIAVAAGLYFLIQHSRIGMLIRAGATHREMVRALGVNIKLLYTIVFGLGAMLAALGGVLAGPLLSVQVGMGEQILILTFVVIVIGGMGSVRGALIGSLLVGIVDTLIRAYGSGLLMLVMEPAAATKLGAGLSAIGAYVLMAIVLLTRARASLGSDR